MENIASSGQRSTHKKHVPNTHALHLSSTITAVPISFSSTVIFCKASVGHTSMHFTQSILQYPTSLGVPTFAIPSDRVAGPSPRVGHTSMHTPHPLHRLRKSSSTTAPGGLTSSRFGNELTAVKKADEATNPNISSMNSLDTFNGVTTSWETSVLNEMGICAFS